MTETTGGVVMMIIRVFFSFFFWVSYISTPTRRDRDPCTRDTAEQAATSGPFVGDLVHVP